MHTKLLGTGVAVITPFTASREIDFHALEKLINHLINNGVDYLVVQGTTGESATTTKEEKQALLQFFHEKVQGRVPLVMGIGGNNTNEVLKNLEFFDSSKYDAVLSVSPYYNKPSQEGIYQHYKTVARATSKPVILYNVPGRTGSNITASTTIRLANDVENIVAIKEASGNLEQSSEIIRDKPSDFLVISGDDALTLPMISIGAKGVISVVAHVAPKQFSEMVNSALEGTYSKAQAIHLSLLKITQLIFKEGNPAGVKAALEIMKIIEKHVRLPLWDISKELYEEIRKELKKLQIIE